MSERTKRIEENLNEIDGALESIRGGVGSERTYALLLLAKSTALGALAAVPAEITCSADVQKFEAFLGEK
ncbi:MAG: hypothetical protein JWN30_850 [Bacilli bacterium]|nr:hypothetical protein [Bacilli bacterium]